MIQRTMLPGLVVELMSLPYPLSDYCEWARRWPFGADQIKSLHRQIEQMKGTPLSGAELGAVLPAPAKPPSKPRGAMVDVACPTCGETFTARVADRNRGWGVYCSKKCKAEFRNTL